MKPIKSLKDNQFVVTAYYRNDDGPTVVAAENDFQKNYPLVDGLIVDKASSESILAQVVQDLTAFIDTFRTIVDTTDLPAYGSKLEETQSLDIKELAALMRQQIASDIKTGKLPKGLKTSVTIDRGGYLGNISIRITQLPEGFRAFSDSFLEHFGTSQQNNYDRLSNEYSALQKYLEAIHGQYNYNRSDPYSDYSDYRYYGGVSLAIDNRLRHEQELLKQAKEKNMVDDKKLDLLIEQMQQYKVGGFSLDDFKLDYLTGSGMHAKDNPFMAGDRIDTEGYLAALDRRKVDTTELWNALTVPETEQEEQTDLEQHVSTLKSISHGEWDNKDLETIYQAIANAVEAIEEAGAMAEYDPLIGEASMQYANLDQQRYG